VIISKLSNVPYRKRGTEGVHDEHTSRAVALTASVILLELPQLGLIGKVWELIDIVNLL